MGSAASGPKLGLIPDPVGFLENWIAVEVRRRVAEDGIDHYVYGQVDMSVRSGNARVRRCYDRKWRCFDNCRPFLERDEAGRILQAFSANLMFLHLVSNAEKTAIQRHVKSRSGNYVSVPLGGHIAVLSDAALGEESYAVPDKNYLVRKVVMKARWDDLNLSSTRGFLPPARAPKISDRWEAHHPSTGRTCNHLHTDQDEAAACAAAIGKELDDSNAGWYVRCTSEWKAAGTVRMTTLNKLAASAQQCGLRVVVSESDQHSANGSLTILGIGWSDPGFVRWREENDWAFPSTATRWWRPPTGVEDWLIDHRGRITGS